MKHRKHFEPLEKAYTKKKKKKSPTNILIHIGTIDISSDKEQTILYNWLNQLSHMQTK